MPRSPQPLRRRTGRRGRRVLGLTTALTSVLTAAVLAGGALPAVAADPVNPSDGELSDAQTAQQQAAAEVARLAGLVAAAQQELEKAEVQAEAAGVAYEAAEEARRQADAAAAEAARQLQDAQAAVAAAQARIADFSSDSYKNGSALTSEMALLDVQGPGELVEKAAMLEYVADHQLDVLGTLQAAQTRQSEAEAAARTAQQARTAAEEKAKAAQATAQQQLAAQQTAMQQVSDQKAQLDQQLQDAQVHLLQLQGARNAYQQWQAQKAAAAEAARKAQAAAQARTAAEAAAAVKSGTSAGYVRPASGTTSSCYGARWGVSHLGVDIAAPIGTPIYAAESGVVQRAGAATGFGQAVYLRGSDGAVTVYGHVNRYFVAAGDRVKAGQEIAEVGNRGQSTGPHLHFEVHPDGAMYSGTVDPVPYLRAHGISISGCS